MPLKMYQGESRPVAIRISQKGAAFPIQDSDTVFVGVKRDLDDLFYDFWIDDADIGKGQGQQGLITFTPTPAQTNINPGAYKIQARIKRGGLNIFTLVGDLEILEGVIPYDVLGILMATLAPVTATGVG